MIKQQINLLEVFCYIDDFCKKFEPEFYQHMIGEKTFKCTLAMSEVLTILILFHFSGFKTFKYFYIFLHQWHKKEFPNLLSYSHFIEIERHFLVPLISFLDFHFADCDDISYIDSTPLKICHNKRIYSNKVFKNTARRGKSTMGWFFGFKLHIATNANGELLNAQFTKGNVDDRKVVPSLCKKITGRLFGDKGYISQKLFEEMLKKGLRIVTALRTKMKPKLMVFDESELLKKRSVIESVFHILKDILTLNHTRHRSPINFMVNLIGALCAYCLYPNKPAIKMNAVRTSVPALIFI